MFDLRRFFLGAALMPLLTDDRRSLLSAHDAQVGSIYWLPPATYPSRSRRPGTRAHRAWRRRRAAGRA